jgi:predicted ATPase
MSEYHKLRKVVIKGYKSIKDISLDITDMNVLIGQNGAGKSNFISVFKLLRNIIEERLQYTVQKQGGAESLLHYGSKETKRISLGVDFNPNMYQIDLVVSQNDSLFIEKEMCYFDTGYNINPYRENINNAGATESALIEYTKKYKHGVGVHVYKVMKEWRVYHFHDTSETAGVKKYCSIIDNLFLFEDASNLAAFLYIMRETENEYYERIVKTIQLVIPFFKDFSLRPNPLNSETIRLEWQDKFSDKIFSPHEFSDGSLRFICMATLLLQKKMPKLILLDEPELGLHPSAVTILAGLLKKASKRSQVIVSTQSVNLVNEFDGEDIIVSERNNGATIFNRLDPERLESWLNEYSLGELWDKNIIGGKP